MKKAEFIQQLKQHLRGLSEQEVKDIIRDQEEYIHEAISSGRQEEEVVTALGSPKTLAQNLIAELKLERVSESLTVSGKARSLFPAMLAILALAPLNILFVLGPFMALVGILFGLWALCFGLLAGSGAGFLTLLATLFALPLGGLLHFAGFLFVLGCFGLSYLLFVVVFHVSRLFIEGTLAYLRWNMAVITGKA